MGRRVNQLDMTLSLQGGALRGPQPEQAYLTIFEVGTSRIVHLPAAGEVVIGRAKEVDLRVENQTLSRRHARLILDGGRVQVEDLGSHNGTRVNGEAISGPRLLSSGDVLTFCDVTMVLRRDLRPSARRPLARAEELARRGEEEVERARLYGRLVSLLVLRLPEAEGGFEKQQVALLEALGRVLRLLDVAAWGSPRELWLLRPEIGGDDAAAGRQRIHEALDPSLGVEIGVASFPEDGGDFDALLGAARATFAPVGGGAATTAPATGFELAGRAIVAVDPAMTRLFALLRKLAAADLPVLIGGETGTGKEIAAQALHQWSKRAAGPLVALNCAAMPEALVESELFGHERGAFSGAVAARPGRFEAASGGTLFLDEVGELTGATQAKLLRVLETQRVTRLGDNRERVVDFRLVAATHRDLEREVLAGRFRHDLLFRLGSAQVRLPPLRDRPREIPLLARSFLAEACARAGAAVPPLSAEVMRVLLAHRWPGNVRELKGVMDYVAATAEGLVEAQHLPATLQGAAPGSVPAAAAAPRTPFRPLDEEVRELERSRMAAALQATGGKRKDAAALIAMPLRTFVTKLGLYGLADVGRGGDGEG